MSRYFGKSKSNHCGTQFNLLVTKLPLTNHYTVLPPNDSMDLGTISVCLSPSLLWVNQSLRDHFPWSKPSRFLPPIPSIFWYFSFWTGQRVKCVRFSTFSYVLCFFSITFYVLLSIRRIAFALKSIPFSFHSFLLVSTFGGDDPENCFYYGENNGF